MKRGEIEEPAESDAFAGAPHPRHAQTLIGHKAAEAEFLSAYRDGRLAPAWLISGAEGVGKATLAWRFARFVLANPDPYAQSVREAADLHVDPNNRAARHLSALAHPDFSLMRREWKANPKRLATEIAVEDVREALKIFQLAAGFGGWRISIVDCAEDLNRSSANALLKLIEEPPQRSLILIVSHRPGQVMPTIRSRCRRLRLDPLRENDIATVIAGLGPPWSESDPAAISGAARRAHGSVREALTRLAPEAKEIGALIDSNIRGLPHPDPRAVARLAEALGPRTANEAYQAFHRDLYDWLATRAFTTVSSASRADAIATLWDRIRAAARETETLNLDRKLHVLAVFAEIAASERRR